MYKFKSTMKPLRKQKFCKIIFLKFSYFCPKLVVPIIAYFEASQVVSVRARGQGGRIALVLYHCPKHSHGVITVIVRGFFK